MMINGTVCGKITAENGKIYIPIETDNRKYIVEAYGEAESFAAFGDGIPICAEVRRITRKSSEGDTVRCEYVYRAVKISVKI